MSNGSKTYKIFFPISTNEKWLGGLNYYKNLFHAISLCEKNIDIYIPKENAEILFKYAKPYEIKKDFKYKTTKLFSSLSFKKFDKDSYFKKNYYDNFDLISHVQKPQLYSKSTSWIPDFQHVYLKELFSEQELQRRDEEHKNFAQNSNIVILSSNDAKNDFIKLFPNQAHKARVLNFVSYINPEIYENSDLLSEQIKQKFNPDKKYFYVPNQFWQHKNHITLFRAVDLLKKQDLDIKIICSGCLEDSRNKSHIDMLNDFIRENNLSNNIRFLGIINLDEVYYLMRNCVSIINPSLFEGWSSTVEEAKSLGKNIILSDLNVHKEQNPPEARYFERNNFENLAQILKENWLNRESAPDLELEENARKTMQSRMIDFGNQYFDIVKELF